ncbi:MAG: hypothetical protein N3D10_02305 [Candidatus Micrarchaeota archaeon]|nr:hypothetical protein [Candidatus Micrarchaeota archaeon]
MIYKSMSFDKDHFKNQNMTKNIGQSPISFQRVEDRTRCNSCTTNCLDEVLKVNSNLRYQNLPLFLRQKMEKFKETIVKVNESIERKNFFVAKQKKEEAMEIYEEMLKGIKQYLGIDHPLAQNFYYFVELILKRHTTPQSYNFLNE